MDARIKSGHDECVARGEVEDRFTRTNFNFQTAKTISDVSSRPRGAMRPSRAFISRPHGGRGECRVPAAPAASCALCIGRKHTSNNEYTGTPGIPARNGFLHRGLDWANHIDPVQQIRPCARAAWAGWPTGFALMRAQHVTEGA